MATNPRAPAPYGDEPSDRLTGAGGGPHDGRVEHVAERLASLEGTLKGATWALGLFLAAILALMGSGGVFVVFQIEDTKEQVQLSEQRLNARMGRLESGMDQLDGRLDSRMDRTEAKVDALPGQLSAIANSIANAITATRQQPVIITLPPSEAPAPPEWSGRAR